MRVSNFKHYAHTYLDEVPEGLLLYMSIHPEAIHTHLLYEGRKKVCSILNTIHNESYKNYVCPRRLHRHNNGNV